MQIDGNTYTALFSKGISFVENRPMLIATWGTFFAAAAIGFYMEFAAERQTLSLRSFVGFCFPWKEWKGKSTRVDAIMYVLAKVTDPLMGSASLAITGFLAFYLSRFLDRAMPLTAKSHAGWVAAVLCAIVFFLAMDFANYATHLMEHKVPFFWEFHKVHHSANFLNPFTTARIHPFEKLVDGAFSGLLVGLLAGFVQHRYSFSLAELLGLAASANAVGTVIVLDSLRHSQFPVSFGPLDRVLLSPHMHHLHHSTKREHWDKNMGNKLSIWDWCFNTGFQPQPGETLEFGTGQAEDIEYQSVIGCYALPFIKSFRMARDGKLTWSFQPDPQSVPTFGSSRPTSQHPQMSQPTMSQTTRM